MGHDGAAAEVHKETAAGARRETEAEVHADAEAAEEVYAEEEEEDAAAFSSPSRQPCADRARRASCTSGKQSGRP